MGKTSESIEMSYIDNTKIEENSPNSCPSDATHHTSDSDEVLTSESSSSNGTMDVESKNEADLGEEDEVGGNRVPRLSTGLQRARRNSIRKAEQNARSLEAYKALVDVTGLAYCLKGADDHREAQEYRLSRLEQLVDKIPGEYVSVNDVTENTERMDFLTGKMEKLLADAERTQKMDSIKLSSEIEGVLALTHTIEARMLKSETELRSTSDFTRRINDALTHKASVDEIASLRVALEGCVDKTDFSILQNELGQYASKLELEAIRDELINGGAGGGGTAGEEIIAQLDNLKSAMNSLVSREEMSRMEEQVRQIIEDGQNADENVQTLSDALEKLEDKAEDVQEILTTKANMIDLQREVNTIKAAMNQRVDDLKSAQSRLSDLTEALSDSVGINAKTIESHGRDLQRLEAEIGQRISVEDWDQIERDLEETFAAKTQVTKTVEPIVKKLNQLVAKMIEIDEVIQRKSDLETTIENREHIQDLFRLLNQQLNSTTTPSGGGGAVAAAANSTQASNQTTNEQQQRRASSDVSSGRQQQVEAVANMVPGGGHDDLLRRLAEQDQILKQLQLQSAATNEQLRTTISAQQQRIENLEAQVVELKGVILQRDTGHIDKLSMAERMDRQPSAPLAGGPGDQQSPRAGLFPLSSDKEKWEKAEKERWLTEMRSTTISSSNGKLNTGGTAGLPQIPKK